MQLTFDHYAAFINLEAQLTSASIPSRPTTQSDLFKIFDFPATSSSKKSRPAVEEVVEDEDTELDEEDNGAMDGDDDDDENSKDSEWGKNDDIAPIEGETREERTKRRTSHKDAATLRSDRLKAESSEAVTILSSSRKLPKSSPVPLYQPWSRRHAIASHAPKDAFRGINLIRYHTWHWAATSPNSWVRSSRILAGSAIVEHCVIMDYRHKLIGDTNGGLCFLRNKIEAVTEPYRVVIKKGPRQTTLFSKKPAAAATSIPSSSIPIPLEWADQLVAPPSTIEDFDLDDEVANHGREVTQSRQRNSFNVPSPCSKVFQFSGKIPLVLPPRRTGLPSILKSNLFSRNW